jgi:PIN domain nuclease of toxin-antitoxin system
VIVLDTHVWIWWVEDDPRLSRLVRDQFDAESDVRVSAISLLEIATAAALGRLTLQPSPATWLQIAQAPQSLHVEPLTDHVCLESVQLPGSSHRDPADRLIVALARLLDVPLVTAD